MNELDINSCHSLEQLCFHVHRSTLEVTSMVNSCFRMTPWLREIQPGSCTLAALWRQCVTLLWRPCTLTVRCKHGSHTSVVMRRVDYDGGVRCLRNRLSWRVDHEGGVRCLRNRLSWRVDHEGGVRCLRNRLSWRVDHA